MSSQYDQQQETGRMTNADFLRIIYFACNVHATSIAVFIRRGFGREALGWNSLCAIVVLIFLAGEDRAFLGYVVLFLFAQIWRRVETFRLLRSGIVLHSRYPGYPYWAMKVPFVTSEENAMSGIEPLMCFLGGALLCPVSVNIGGYVMLGALTLGIRGGIEREIDRKRIQQMKDAALEQQWYSEQMRR
jgi:hypothetical protein